jgi:hypothetical protein
MTVRRRDLVVLDEPEQHLDPDARVRLGQWLAEEKNSGWPFSSPPTTARSPPRARTACWSWTTGGS